jgi:hypothetical protein
LTVRRVIVVINTSRSNTTSYPLLSSLAPQSLTARLHRTELQWIKGMAVSFIIPEKRM